MSYTTEEKREIVRYFTELNHAIAVQLRPSKGKLGPEWLGIDREARTMLVYFCEDGCAALLIGKRLDRDEEVRIGRGKSFHEACTIESPGIRWYPGVELQYSVYAKNIVGTGWLGLCDMRDGHFRIDLADASSSAFIVQPKIIVATARERKASLPPWAIGFISRRTGLQVLDGLDQDPILQARAITDSILARAGLIPEEPKERYHRVRMELLEAMETEPAVCEKNLHAVIEKYSWILFDSHVVDGFHSKPKLVLQERAENEAEAMEAKERCVYPDFIFDLIDRRSVMVEIEAATKPILQEAEETGFQLPYAKATAACCQIQNYKLLMERYGADFCRQLGKPDTWPFSYLLVIGRDSKIDDKKSWDIFRRRIEADGIEVKSWDYYLQKLERLERATFHDAAVRPMA